MKINEEKSFVGYLLYLKIYYDKIIKGGCVC